jgi:hypothetical protein
MGAAVVVRRQGRAVVGPICDASARGRRPGVVEDGSWLAACKFGELGTMVAGIAAHLLMQDALAALLAAEPLPVAVDGKRAATFRIGTGPDYRFGWGLATGHGLSSGLVKSPMVSAFSRFGTLKIRADLSPWSSHLGTTVPARGGKSLLGRFLRPDSRLKFGVEGRLGLRTDPKCDDHGQFIAGAKRWPTRKPEYG